MSEDMPCPYDGDDGDTPAWLLDSTPPQVPGLAAGAELLAAVSLLAQTAGTARVAAGPEAARHITRYCGGLPLALYGVAGRLALSPRQLIADSGTRLAAAHGWLDAGTAEETAVQASPDLSCAALDLAATRPRRLQGLHPGPDFSTGLVLSGAQHPRDPATRGALTALPDPPSGR